MKETIYRNDIIVISSVADQYYEIWGKTDIIYMGGGNLKSAFRTCTIKAFISDFFLFLYLKNH